MGSRRLPGKALAEIAGKPLLQRLCDRMKLCRRADQVIVATSDQREDNAIAEACADWEFPVYRGPAKDLTTRLLGAAKANQLDAIVRVTGDNPLTDPGGIDALIEAFLALRQTRMHRLIVVHNMHVKGYPYGTGAECISRQLIEFCDEHLRGEEERENFALFAKQHSKQFECVKIDAPPSLLRSNYFLTVDFPEDLVLQREIHACFSGCDDISTEKVIEFLDANPALAKSNAHLHSQFSE